MKSDFIKPESISLFDWLFVACVVAVAATISIPTLLSSRRTQNEKAALGVVRLIHVAQVGHYWQIGRKSHADFDQLRAAGLIDEAFTGTRVVKNDYMFIQSITADGNGYCAKASPLAGETKHFGIDQKGVAYQSSAESDIACSEGILTIRGGAAPRY